MDRELKLKLLVVVKMATQTSSYLASRELGSQLISSNNIEGDLLSRQRNSQPGFWEPVEDSYCSIAKELHHQAVQWYPAIMIFWETNPAYLTQNLRASWKLLKTLISLLAEIFVTIGLQKTLMKLFRGSCKVMDDSCCSTCRDIHDYRTSKGSWEAIESLL